MARVERRFSGREQRNASSQHVFQSDTSVVIWEAVGRLVFLVFFRTRLTE